MDKIVLELLPFGLSICKFQKINGDVSNILNNSLFSVLLKTPEETSVVIETRVLNTIKPTSTDNGWVAYKIQGVLDFNQTGILDRLISQLAFNEISVFTISSYNTDYLLIQEKNLARANFFLSRVAHIVGRSKEEKLIYFSASVSSGRNPELVNHYQYIVYEIINKKARVLTDHLANQNLQQSGDPTKTEKQVCETDMDFFHQSHGLIAHISQASTGVGFEIGLATALHKPILCLGYKEFPARISPMISGNKHIQLYLYQNLDDTVAVINTFIDNL
jgi:hypothetical protein